MKTNPQNKTVKEPPKTRKNKADSRLRKIPFGREQVKTAILDATEKLLLEHSPIEITVREIAKLAQVKHPLIHRHFGTKDALIMAVHTRTAENVQQVIEKIGNLEGNIETFFLAVEKNRLRQLALARAMIDGVDPQLLQNQFSVMQLFLRLVEKKQKESKNKVQFDSKVLAAVLGATALGWMLYEPFLLAATGLEKENKGEIKHQVAQILEEFVKQIC